MASRAAIKVTRWTLLLVSLALLLGLAWLFWLDVGDGRAARETARTESAQQRLGEAAPSPAAPLQAPAR